MKLVKLMIEKTPVEVFEGWLIAILIFAVVRAIVT